MKAAAAWESTNDTRISQILQTGLNLSRAYLDKFSEKREHLKGKRPFYTQLKEETLKELLLKDPTKYIHCTIKTESSHRAYCLPIASKSGYTNGKIEISGRSKCGMCFTDDEVVVEVLQQHSDNDTEDGKTFGKVLGVLKRHRSSDVKNPVFVCTLDAFEGHLVKPICKTVPKIHILNPIVSQKYQNLKKYKVELYEYDGKGELVFKRFLNIDPGKRGQYVFLVVLLTWSPTTIYPLGAVINILPFGQDLKSAINILQLQYGVPCLYEPQTVKAVKSLTTRVPDELPPLLTDGRKDITDKRLFTIDPPHSSDLDDALSIEEHNGDFMVGVHIADVASVVSKNDPIDREAKQRAVTFYTVRGNINYNMLPEPLSQGLCSLLPNQKRLAISIFFRIDKSGKLIKTTQPTRTVIRSCHQFSYEEAQKIINGEPSMVESSDNAQAQV